MKERPIPFTGPMVRAILTGKKTQTRRVIKPQPETWGSVKRKPFVHPDYPGIWSPLADNSENRTCPFGVPGQRLWVREACERYGLRNFLTDEATDVELVRYCADVDALGFDLAPWFKRATCPPMFMPRWASRISLEVTDVRVERVQDISEEEAKAEGVEESRCGQIGHMMEPAYSHRTGFVRAWELINGKRPGCAWADNPFVWVLTFRRLENTHER